MEEQIGAPTLEDQDQGDLWRLQGIFFEPAKTFQSINKRPSFWLPLLITIIILLLLWQGLSHFVDLEDLFLQEARKNPQTESLTDEQLEQQLKFTVPFIKWVSPVVAPPIMLFLFSALILGMVFLSGSETSYKKLLGVTSHCLFLQALIGTALTLLVYALASDPKAIDIQNPVYTNLGPLVDAKESPILARLAASVDLVVWYVIYLLGLGTATVSKRMTVGKGVMLVALLYIFYVLLGVGWTALWNA
jgi:hypothetical protein